MERLSPEERLAELRQQLKADLDWDAPRLGTHPDRVKANAMWVWIGAVFFGGVTATTDGLGDAIQQMTWGGIAATVLCLAVALLYERHFWGMIEKARAAHRERLRYHPQQDPADQLTGHG